MNSIKKQKETITQNPKILAWEEESNSSHSLSDSSSEKYARNIDIFQLKEFEEIKYQKSKEESKQSLGHEAFMSYCSKSKPQLDEQKKVRCLIANDEEI